MGIRRAAALAKRARMNCEKWREYFKENINAYHDMHDFIFGKQWSDQEENDMIKTFQKVPLVSNQLSPLANFLMGEQQQNTPQLQVVPLQNCDEQTAALREAIVKDITLSTDAKSTYQVAAGQAFIGGYGAFLWETEYSSPNAFEQKIVPRYFKDATLCYWDRGAEHINKIDGMHCGFISRMTRKKFGEIYGKNVEEKIKDIKSERVGATKEEVNLVTGISSSIDAFAWATDDAITINDYFERKANQVQLYLLSNDKIVKQDELDGIIEYSKMFAALQMIGDAQTEEELDKIKDADVITLYDPDTDEPITIADKKTSIEYTVMHYKLAGDYLLEKSECASKLLPMPFVDQHSYFDKNGKQICRPYFIDCKDTQRYINYLRTQSAYILKISRYDQYIGSKRNAASNDTQAQWRNPNAIKGMLTFDESPTGVVPQQVKPPELSQSLLTQYQLAIEDIYRISGLYPTRMGDQGNEISGAAIDARTRQGSYVTYVAFNSINNAIAAGGRIVNEMIPNVYDSERVLSITMPDKGIQTLTINKQLDEYGEIIENDLRKGEFEVRLVPGPSFEGQKQEALNALKEILQVDPKTFQLIADLYADNLPLPNTIEIKNRLKTMVPPQVIQAGKTGEVPQQNQQPSPEEMAIQAQIQQKEQELKIQEAKVKLDYEKQKEESERELMRIQNERIELAAKLEETKLRYLAETDRTAQDAAANHADNIVKILTHTPKGD